MTAGTSRKKGDRQDIKSENLDRLNLGLNQDGVNRRQALHSIAGDERARQEPGY